MNASVNLARTAGVLYLILIVTGVLGIAYVPSQIIDWSSPAATVTNIKTQALLFRFGIVATVVCYTSYIILGLILFRLFNSVNSSYSIALLTFVAIGTALEFINCAHLLNVFTLINNSALDSAAVEAQVMFLLEARNNGYQIGNVFWGLWLLPFGLLLLKSKLAPRFLGYALVLSCFTYLIEFILKIQFAVTEAPWFLSLVSSVGEFGICLWLIIKGFSDQFDPVLLVKKQTNQLG